MSNWTIWGVRFVLSLAGTAAVAWYVSFAIADYVVRANTSSANEAMSALQSSIDRLNESVIVNNTQLATINDRIVGLTQASAEQGVQIDVIRKDLAKVQSSVQDYGIDIKASYEAISENMLGWTEIRDIYSVPDGQPVQWKIVPVIEE